MPGPQRREMDVVRFDVIGPRGAGAFGERVAAGFESLRRRRARARSEWR